VVPSKQLTTDLTYIFIQRWVRTTSLILQKRKRPSISKTRKLDRKNSLDNQKNQKQLVIVNKQKNILLLVYIYQVSI